MSNSIRIFSGRQGRPQRFDYDDLSVSRIVSAVTQNGKSDGARLA